MNALPCCPPPSRHPYCTLGAPRASIASGGGDDGGEDREERRRVAVGALARAVRGVPAQGHRARLQRQVPRDEGRRDLPLLLLWERALRRERQVRLGDGL